MWEGQGEWKEGNSRERFLGEEKLVAPFKSSFSGQSEKKSSVGCSSPKSGSAEQTSLGLMMMLDS